MILSKITAKLVIFVAALDTTKMIIMPNFSLLMWVGVLMVADFITGLIKAKVTKQQITSERMRASIIKFLQYFGCIGLVIVLLNQKGNSPEYYTIMRWAQDGLTILILYIETLSVLENLYQMDMKNPFAMYVIKPLYSLLSLAVKNNPLNRQAQEQKKKQTGSDELDDIDKAID